MAICNNLSTTREAEIQSRIDQLETFISQAYDAMTGALTTDGVKQFKFDSGEASQSAQYYDFEQLTKVISGLWSQIDFWNRKLNGRANVNLGLRRKYSTFIGGIV